MPLGVLSLPVKRSWFWRRGDRDASSIVFDGAPFDPTGCTVAINVYDGTGTSVVALSLTTTANGYASFATDANGYTSLNVVVEAAGSLIPQNGAAYTFDVVLTYSDGTPVTLVDGSLVFT